MRYKKFHSIPIDEISISKSDLNIEIKNQTNLFQWNGQFSPQFVEVILKKYSRPGNRLIDPFLGSGTTLFEACKLGIDIVGVELNPAAYKLSRIYRFCNIDICEREKILGFIENSILTKQTITCNSSDENVIDIIDVLKMMCEKGGDDLVKEWKKLKEIVMMLPYSHNQIYIMNDDSRHVKLQCNYFDLLFTSPPYINVFNYHQQYRSSIEKMGYNILQIAKAEIGSNRKNRSNRFYSVVQYCIDMTVVIGNLLESMKDNSRMIFVVGRSSTVLGISFCNSRIIYDILVRVYKCQLIIRQERCFKNKYGKMIYEDILHFTVTKEWLNREYRYYINYARKIGRECIDEKMTAMGEMGEKYFLLKDAYEASNTIGES